VDHLQQTGSTSSEVIPTRNDQLNRLDQMQKQIAASKSDKFDLVVIGGGATGTGIALDASTRGLRVCLLEKDDFASGTSSRSTKMAHGGVRYLQRAVNHLDLNEMHFVYDSLRERQHFFNVAPHLVNALPILTPCYNYWDAMIMYCGLKLYDFLSMSSPSAIKPVEGYSVDTISKHPVKWVSPDDMNRYCPTLKKSGLVGAVMYYDGCFNDARIALSNVLTAASMGACVVNHCKVVKILKDPASKKCSGVVAVDELTGKKYEIRANCVVNATGYLSDSILRMDRDDTVLNFESTSNHDIIRPSSGVHLSVDRSLTPENTGLLFPKTKDGRVLFVVPWQDRTIIGTTDHPESLDQLKDQPPKPKQEDIDYILEHLADSFDKPITKDQVLSTWSGIRPLVDPSALKHSDAPTSGTTAALPRDHVIQVGDSGLVTICGGKWTTFRRMAEETVDKAIEVSSLHPNHPQSMSAVTPLIGAPYKFDMSHLNSLTNLNLSLSNHLFHYYGSKSIELIEYGKKKLGKNWNRKLSDKFDFIEAEVVHHARSEYACRATDVIAYRTNLMLLDRSEAIKAVPRVVDLLGDELGWNSRRRQIETAKCLAYIDKCTI